MMKTNIEEVSLRDLVEIIVVCEKNLFGIKSLSKINYNAEREAKIEAFKDSLNKLYKEIYRRQEIYERGYE